MEKSDFLEIVNSWADYSEKFIRKTLIRSVQGEQKSEDYTLEIGFNFKEKTIVNRIDIKDLSNLDTDNLNEILLDLEVPFYKDVRDFIEENWNDIEKIEPPHKDEIDLLIYYPTMKIDGGKTRLFSNYIFTTGRYVLTKIITPDSNINFNLEIGQMRVIYWNYLE